MSARPISAPVQDTAELTSLTERLGLLLVVRLFMAAVVLFSVYALPQLPLSDLAMTSAWFYAGVSMFVEGLHRMLTRRTRRRWLVLINLMLIFDGLFIATVLADSGPSRSVLLFLAYMHVVSVTLLVGFRTGLKIAAWHSILLLTVYYLMLAGWLNESDVFGPGVNKNLMSKELEVAQACALWLVAIVTAVFSSLNERELRRRKGELTIIADLSSAIEQTRRPSEILQALVDTTTEKLGCSRAVAICAHGSELIIIGGNKVEVPQNGETLASIGGVIAQTAETQLPVFIRRLDVETDKFIERIMPDARNVAAIPLVAEGEAMAVLITEWGNAGKRRVTRPMIDLISNVAGRVALSLSNTFLLAEIHRLASVDGLTNLPNRRTFNMAIERELSRSARSGVPVSLVMLDIDHFKSVNDRYGHQMGDRVLTESASGVMQACRGEDLPARYGGEEIAIIMPNCSVDDALQAAERIRQALGNANVALRGVCASAGVATFPNNAQDVAGLLSAADEALYKSKDAGRNRTTVSTRSSQPAPVSVHH